MAYFRKRGCKCPNKKKCNCDAKWSFTMDAGRDPITNERIQITRSGFSTKKEAQAMQTELENELNKGTYVEETTMPFKDYAYSWLEKYAASGEVKKGSVRVRGKEINMFLKYFNKIPIKDITKKMYSDVLLDMLKCGFADNTIAGAHGAAKMIFKKALEEDLLKSDPTQYARAPKTITTVESIEANEDIPKYLEKEELAVFLHTAQMNGLPGDYEMFLTLAYTGIRVGELVVLKDTDIVDGVISITKTYYNPMNNAKKYELEPPKTKKAIRKIEVEPIVIKAIERYSAKVKEFKMLHRDIYYDKGYLFPNTKKYPGYPNFIKTVENRMARLLKIARLNESLTPHSLRHTHTSLLAEAGVTLEEIMDRLGHKDDSVTKNVYLHVTKTRKKEASQKFGELMQSL